MDQIESTIEDILDGKPVPNCAEDCIDLTLAEQIDELASKGIENLKISSQFKPVIQNTVTYIVVAVIFNEKNEVLLIQEAKSSCAGTWYLPAGRMEPGETIVEGVKREVLEETGLDLEPTTLVMLECAQGHWWRFVLTGRITGGELKTVAQADAESIQAQWFGGNIEQITLRANDIMPLIDRCKAYLGQPEEVRHPPLLPTDSSHSKLLLRLVILIKKKANNKAHVLVSEKGEPHLPTIEINPRKSVHSLLKRYMQNLFRYDLPIHKPSGVLGVEHAPGETDGLCITVLVSCRDPLESFTLSDGHTWLEVSSSLGRTLVDKTGKFLSVALHVIH